MDKHRRLRLKHGLLRDLNQRLESDVSTMNRRGFVQRLMITSTGLAAAGAVSLSGESAFANHCPYETACSKCDTTVNSCANDSCTVDSCGTNICTSSNLCDKDQCTQSDNCVNVDSCNSYDICRKDDICSTRNTCSTDDICKNGNTCNKTNHDCGYLDNDKCNSADSGCALVDD